MAERWKVFLDTNVFIAGLASRTGASAAILDLAEAEEIILVCSQQVVMEADRVFSAKFPQLIDRFREFFRNLALLLIDDPALNLVREAVRVIDPDDAAILAAAKMAEVDYLVTLDTKYFHKSKVRDYLNLPIVTPAEFLTAFRDFWEQKSH